MDDISTNSLACFQAIRAAHPYAPIIVFSPFWKGANWSSGSRLIECYDRIKASAAAVTGTVWVDFLQIHANNLPAAGVLSASSAVSASTISSSIPIPRGMCFRIGGATNAELRRSIFSTGFGPYTIGFNGTDYAGGGGGLSNAHAAGEAILPVGPGIYTGNGNQGSLQGNGNADRYTGSDNTHPTVAGHLNIAVCAYRELRIALGVK